MSFSKDFIWGAATASYQVEGAAFEDGKGLSVWDVCSKKTGFVKEGDTGETACDDYHRFKEDVGLIKQIGLKAYRMSISWPRVLPYGTGRVNEKGLEYYERLFDELLKNNITPYVTLFHWDYPFELYKRGGWLNPDSSDWFAEYVKVIVNRFSDRINHWFTLNEPQCHIILGHYDGIHAPGLKLDKGQVLLAIHNILLAHGKAVQNIRQYSKTPCKIGIAPNPGIYYPQTDSREDVEAAKKMMFGCMDDSLWLNTWWLDPVFLGSYPEDGLNMFRKWLPPVGQDDLKTICQPLDFFAMNVYNGTEVRAGRNHVPEFVKNKTGYDQTACKWPVTPQALYWGPKFLYERYKKPIIITENGLSNTDWVSVDGKVHDPQRIDFYYRYLRELKKAAEDGVVVEGYFAWSLMDNFEWALGYNERFGLVYVDFETQKRTIKDSGCWYRSVIESNGEILK